MTSVVLSKEVNAIINYITRLKPWCRIASTFRITTTRHGYPGTDGMGLAVDVAGSTPGRDTDQLQEIFNAFWKVRHLLRELYYSGPGVAFMVRKGEVVPRSEIPQSIIDGHHDHVHASVLKGEFLPLPATQSSKSKDRNKVKYQTFELKLDKAGRAIKAPKTLKAADVVSYDWIGPNVREYDKPEMKKGVSSGLFRLFVDAGPAHAGETYKFELQIKEY